MPDDKPKTKGGKAATFKWRPGHDPNDPDAWDGSGWEYPKFIPEASRPEGPKVTGTGGPEAGMPCLQEGCNLPLRIIQGFEPKEILGYLEASDLVIPKVEDRVMILMCSNDHAVQMRESLLPIKTRLGL